MRVLVTGAAGSIGRVVTVGLTDRGHEVVALDLVPAPEGHEGPWHTVDCADPDAVAAVFAAESPDAVVHLAGVPGEEDLPTEITSHVVTTAALLEAMVAHDVHRIVYASSNHAVGRTPRADLADGLLTTEARPRPDTFYGTAKVAAEALLSLYADRFGIDAVACRIGSFLEQPEVRRNLATWLSHDDCVRMVEAALTAPAPGLPRALRHQRQHPGVVGPRARPGDRLRAAGRRGGLGRPAPRPTRGRRGEQRRRRPVPAASPLPARSLSRQR